MGKRLISQRRGKGSNIFQATKNAVADVKYIDLDDEQKEGVVKGQVVDLINDAGRTAVLAEVLFENGLREYTIAAEGLSVGQEIQCGKKADLDIGNVIPLKELVEGCPVFNIEKSPSDGGIFIRSSGLYGIIVTKDKKNVYVKLPSGKTIQLNPDCRATIGCVAGSGRKEKPFIKAGAKYHAMKARRKYYPIVRGVAMNAVSHPFGGSQHHPGKSKSISRHAPSGAKVGAIASKRTGRKKKG